MANENDEFLSPQEIAKADFPISIRGYKPEAVHSFLEQVSEAMEQSEQSGGSAKPRRVRALEKEIAELKSQLSSKASAGFASSGEISEDELVELLGRETTQVISSARTAAADIVASAEQKADALAEEAEKEAAEVRRDAEQYHKQKKNEVHGLLEETQNEADLIISEAKERALLEKKSSEKESAQIIAEAQQIFSDQERVAQKESALIISEAKHYREQLIADLVKQRRTLHDDLSQMFEARASLVASVKSAQTSLETLTNQLDSQNEFTSLLDGTFQSEEKEVEGILIDLDAELPEKMAAIDAGVVSAKPASSYSDIFSGKTAAGANPDTTEVEVVDLQKTSPHIEGSESSRSRKKEIYDFDEDDDFDLYAEEQQVDEIVEEDHVEDEPSIEVVSTIDEPERSEFLMTISCRAYGTEPDDTRGDLPSDEVFEGRIADVFKDKDLAISRSGPEFRRRAKRALNDDQSDVLDRLRAGKGIPRVDELPSLEEQITHYFTPLRKNLASVMQAGMRSGGTKVKVSAAAIDDVTQQLAKHMAVSTRIPVVALLEDFSSSDREEVMDPVRSIYRDFRNACLPSLIDDILHEVFAIGLYNSIEEGEVIRWMLDPRRDPDPLSEINARTKGLTRGQEFPSGHCRPLSISGCRCLVVPA